MQNWHYIRKSLVYGSCRLQFTANCFSLRLCERQRLGSYVHGLADNNNRLAWKAFLARRQNRKPTLALPNCNCFKSNYKHLALHYATSSNRPDFGNCRLAVFEENFFLKVPNCEGSLLQPIRLGKRNFLEPIWYEQLLGATEATPHENGNFISLLAFMVMRSNLVITARPKLGTKRLDLIKRPLVRILKP